MRFAFVKEWRHIWRVETICRVMQVTARGFRKWLTRPMSSRQRGDMKVLAHIRE
jgi:putative transposase